MKIGELARLLEVPIETIRYYEREGLLPAPSRSEGNYRLYTPAHRERLSFIRHCRSLDMALDEIRQLLRFKDAPDAPCGEVNALLDAHIGHVTDRIAELRRLKAQLQGLRDRCDSINAGKDCGILAGLSAEVVVEARRMKHGHVHGAHRRRSA